MSSQQKLYSVIDSTLGSQNAQAKDPGCWHDWSTLMCPFE